MKLMVLDIPGEDPLNNLLMDENLLYLNDGHLIIRFWVNAPSVFMGYSQKAQYEVNLSHIKTNNIPLIKRFTGGGTVYHDKGCLNVTVCKQNSPPLYSRHIDEESRFLTNLIKDGLSKQVPDLETTGINAVFFEGKKILGSSIALKNQRLLYHASLLVNVDLKALSDCLKVSRGYPAHYKYVKSKRSPVINLNMIHDTDISKTQKKLLTHFQDHFGCSQPVLVTSLEKLNQLTHPIPFQPCSTMLSPDP